MAVFSRKKLKEALFAFAPLAENHRYADGPVVTFQKGAGGHMQVAYANPAYRMTITIPCAHGNDLASASVPMSELRKMVSKLPAGEDSLIIKRESGRVIMKAGNVSYPASEVDNDIPMLPHIEGECEYGFTAKGVHIREALRRASPCQSKDTYGRESLEGIYFGPADSKSDTLHIAATDGHALNVSRFPDVDGVWNTEGYRGFTTRGFILPSGPVSSLQRALKAFPPTGNLLVKWQGARHVEFSYGPVTLTTTTIHSHSFPLFTQVIPAGQAIAVNVDRKEALEAARMIHALAPRTGVKQSDTSPVPTAFRLKEKKGLVGPRPTLTIEGKDGKPTVDISRAETVFPDRYKGDHNITFGIRTDLLTHLCSTMTGDSIVLKVDAKTPGSAAILCEEATEYGTNLHVTMPTRL